MNIKELEEALYMVLKYENGVYQAIVIYPEYQKLETY